MNGGKRGMEKSKLNGDARPWLLRKTPLSSIERTTV